MTDTYRGPPVDPNAQLTSGSYPWQKRQPHGGRPSIAPGGYGYVRKDGYRYVWNIQEHKHDLEHRLIWRWHYGDIPPDHEIHHINGNRLDNRIENLALVHYREHCRTFHGGLVTQPDGSVHKKCLACESVLPLECFYPKRGTSQHFANCKPCARRIAREKHRARQALNKEARP